MGFSIRVGESRVFFLVDRVVCGFVWSERVAVRLSEVAFLVRGEGRGLAFR